MARRSARRIIPFLGLLGVLVATAYAGEWQLLRDCQLIESPYNDGDSFHVRSGGREYIFRLCYVDTPETKAMREYTQRTTDQAKYFGINKTTLFEMAAQASELTKRELSRPFTVWTDWTDARGNSQLPRHFGIIQTADHDLAEWLVRRGLSRVYGYSPSRPEGTPSADYRNKLKKLEAAAFVDREGAWAASKRKSPPQSAPVSSSVPDQKSEPAPKRSLDDIPAI